MFAIVNQSKDCNDSDLAFWAAACDAQSRDAAALWGVPYVPVVAASLGGDLVTADTRLILVVDSLDVDGALGYHTDAAGVIYGRVLFQGARTSVTISHEILETLLDPTVDRWMPYRSGSYIAQEICDPVEGDSYDMPVAVLGETRTVSLSNYVLPKWFGGTTGPYDRMELLQAPWTMTAGGYYVIKDKTGERDVFASKRVVGNPGLSRIQNPFSRVLRRLTSESKR